MIRINQLKLPPDHSEEDLQNAVKRALKLNNAVNDSEYEYKIVKRSIDSRRKPFIFYVYSIMLQFKNTAYEKAVLKKADKQNVVHTDETKYVFPYVSEGIVKKRPVIVGFGPAGMFAALFLSKAGFCPVVIERGQRIEERVRTVSHFWDTNELNQESNVQFGEGGAGTFSDGKLNTMVKDPSGRITKVLETFVKAGADSSVLYMNKPHIGTDILCNVVKNIREEILRAGGEIRFDTRMEGFSQTNGKLKSVQIYSEQNGTETLPCKNLILATGHSAGDTFSMLYKKGIEMISKSFAVGLRIEHPQEFIDYNAYGDTVFKDILPSADYKITYQASTQRGIYSFCMCPGGYVVNASSVNGLLAVNGMSYSGRSAANANSALIVTVTPDDFAGVSPLAGLEFQQKLERSAYMLGNSNIPVQLAADFKENRISTGFGRIVPCIKGAYQFANLRTALPEYVSKTMIEGMEHFDRVIPGYDMEDAVFSGIESRTSSPVRIIRDENGESNIKGIYPCGEGAGYAGGIISAALDGIKTAEKIAKKYISI